MILASPKARAGLAKPSRFDPSPCSGPGRSTPDNDNHGHQALPPGNASRRPSRGLNQRRPHPTRARMTVWADSRTRGRTVPYPPRPGATGTTPVVASCRVDRHSSDRCCSNMSRLERQAMRYGLIATMTMIGVFASGSGYAVTCEGGQMPARPDVASRSALPECGFAATKRWGPNGCQLCDPKNVHPSTYHPRRHARRGWQRRNSR